MTEEAATPDHGAPERSERQTPGQRSSAGGGTPAFDLAAALGDLDRATRNFAERLGAQREAGEAAAVGSGFGREPAAPPPSGEGARATFDDRMREAEREAAEYLQHAKRRADSLVNAMVGAVEREAAEMRHEAEAGIRARWQAVEVDTARHVEEARRVADRIVAERQRRIAALSDGIVDRAQALTAGMDDAQRVREQFEMFVRALSEAADRIASTRKPIDRPVGDQGDRSTRDGPSAVAA
jgi:hypothetical protein